MDKGLNRNFFKEDKWPTKMKICSIPLIIEERQIKTMIRYHLTTVRMSTTKTQGKCWKGHEEMRTTVHCWCGEGNSIHSSTFAWKIPWMGEPGGLQSMGSQSQTQLSDLAAAAALWWECRMVHARMLSHALIITLITVYLNYLFFSRVEAVYL